MKNRHNRNLTISVILTLGLITGVAHPSVAATPASTPSEASASTAARASADELFSAVYFLSGEVGEELSVRASLTGTPGFAEYRRAQLSDTVRASEQRAIDWVRDNHSGFLESWRSDVTSGDLVRVQRASRDGARYLAEAATALGYQKQSPQTYVPGEDSHALCATAVIVVAGAVLVAGAFAVVVLALVEAAAAGYNVAVAENVVTDGKSAALNDPESPRWTAILTQQLRTEA